MNVRFLTSAELAERWRVTPSTLHNWRAERRGPDFIRLAGKRGPVLYELAEIERHEQEGKVSCSS
jgi:hypothetical protein